MKNLLYYLLIFFLLGFGLLTLFLSTSVILDLFGIREKEGNYVLFVVWSNFISSILYLGSVYGFIFMKKWTYKWLSLSVVILVIAFLGLMFHIYSGGLYEAKTVGAMMFRISVTGIYALVAYFMINQNKEQKLV